MSEATETKPATPSGLNLWQILTTVLGALLIAAVLGLFNMYGDNIRQQAAFDDLLKDSKVNEAKLEKLSNDFAAFKEATNLRLSTVDNLKTSFDNLNHYASERR